ncbi:glucokinase [Streptosporangium becharense]|uniref:Glucokinase n=1 Tax=Streptosporangium becharense TaxID=1816182 RepID=A0A7W9IKZ7_9ACTN|nr:ROK family protein [Streptosporangium becharense]MBB2913248.1 glucokinase [Streptosporangium becharense]MBB5822231.1 glucokinase [Streptosporangium becharense]
MSSFVVALDVGGTSMKGGLVGRTGEILHIDRRATPRDRGPVAVIGEIRSFIDDLAARGGGTPEGVGLAVPGLVAADAALYSANIGWRDVPAADFVPLDVPVMLGHDVRTGGLAESVLGAGRGVSDFLFLPIGTGIAGAVIVNGEPYGGAAGWGGEIGHIPVFPQGEPCACGQTGCLETYASASAVARRYAARLAAGTDTAEAEATTAAGISAEARAGVTLPETLSGGAASAGVVPGTGTTVAGAAVASAAPAGAAAVTAERIAALTAAGDPVAREVWDDAVEALSLALATYTLLLDPSVIVLGGGLAEAGPLLSDPLTERLRGRLSFRDAPPLRHAALGVNAGMLGAALLGWRAAGFADAGVAWSVDVPKSRV